MLNLLRGVYYSKLTITKYVMKSLMIINQMIINK